MQPKKQEKSSDNINKIDESIVNAEKRRKQVIDKEQSLSDEQLKDVDGGISDLPPWITPTLPEDC